jgi:hypothetical protein
MYYLAVSTVCGHEITLCCYDYGLKIRGFVPLSLLIGRNQRTCLSNTSKENKTFLMTYRFATSIAGTFHRLGKTLLSAGHMSPRIWEITNNFI